MGEGGRGEGEDGGGGRSTVKPVSSTKQSANNGGDSQWDVWKQRAIERQVKEARQEVEDGGGGRSVTKSTTKK